MPIVALIGGFLYRSKIQGDNKYLKNKKLLQYVKNSVHLTEIK
jgi:hypothetical protein